MKKEKSDLPPITSTIFFAVASLILLTLTITLIANMPKEDNASINLFAAGEKPVVLVYKEPDAESDISILLERGTIIEVIEYDASERSDWARVQYGGKTGWVSIDSLSMDQP